MCRYIGKQDIVDELLAVKSRSKRELMERTVRVIHGMREEEARLRERNNDLSNKNMNLMHKAHEAERAFREVNKLCEERGTTEKRLEEQLRAVEQELTDERYRHDRLQDFCVAQGLDLDAVKEALKNTLNSCDHCAHFIDHGDECEGDCENCKAECECGDCRNSSKWKWRGRSE